MSLPISAICAWKNIACKNMEIQDGLCSKALMILFFYFCCWLAVPSPCCPVVVTQAMAAVVMLLQSADRPLLVCIQPCNAMWPCAGGPSHLWRPGPWFNIKMASYLYRKSHCGDKMVVRSSYLHIWIAYTGKMSSLYWIEALGSILRSCCPSDALDFMTDSSVMICHISHHRYYRHCKWRKYWASASHRYNAWYTKKI